MRTLLLGLFLIPTLCYGQGGFVGITAIANVSTSRPSNGGGISGNVRVGKGFYAGMEMSVLKMRDISGVYTPVMAKFTVMPNKNFMMLYQAGYGFTSQENKKVGTDGGFCFFGGVGGLMPTKGAATFFLAVGYAYNALTVYRVKMPAKCIGFRFGLMLK